MGGVQAHFPKQQLVIEPRNQSTRRKTLGAKARTNNKLNPHMTPGQSKKKKWLRWWDASAYSTAPSLPLYDISSVGSKATEETAEIQAIFTGGMTSSAKYVLLRRYIHVYT